MKCFGSSRVWSGKGHQVDLRLEPAGEDVVGLRLGPRPTDWRHRARAKLGDHLFPHLGVVTHVIQIQTFQVQSSGPEAVIVAGNAVPRECGFEAPGSRVLGRLSLQRQDTGRR